MILARAVNVDRHVQRAQVDADAANRRRTRFDQPVFQVGVAQIPGVERPRQVGRVAVPVEQVKRWRCLALEVIANHVIPDQIIGAQKTEGAGQILALHQAARSHLFFAVIDERFIDENVQHTGVREVQEGGQKGRAGHRLLATRGQHRQRATQQRAANAKAQRIDALGSADFLHDRDRLDDGILNVIVPALFCKRCIGVAPAHDKGAVALRHRIADQRVFRLQVQNVELVDAGRHQQEGPLIDFGRQWFVFNQLKQLVFKHHGTLGRRNVLADLKNTLVGHRNMTLAHIVNQVAKALGNAFTLGLDRQLLCLGVEGQKIAWRRGSGQLLHRKADARARLGVGLHRIRQPHQRASIKQIGGSGKRGQRVVVPGLGGKPFVLGSLGAVHTLGPQTGRVSEVLLLQFLQFFRRKADIGWFGWRRRAANARSAQIDVLQSAQGLAPVVSQRLLKLLHRLRPKIRGFLRHAVSCLLSLSKWKPEYLRSGPSKY